jgi:hypothetical protein
MEVPLDLSLRKKHIESYKKQLVQQPEQAAGDLEGRKERCRYCQGTP